MPLIVVRIWAPNSSPHSSNNLSKADIWCDQVPDVIFKKNPCQIYESYTNYQNKTVIVMKQACTWGCQNIWPSDMHLRDWTCPQKKTFWLWLNHRFNCPQVTQWPPSLCELQWCPACIATSISLMVSMVQQGPGVFLAGITMRATIIS